MVKILNMTFGLSALFFVAITSNAVASPPQYGDGNATDDKIRYCARLVNTYGHLSQKFNQEYYGLGVQRPLRSNWEMRLKKPWFSDDLFIVFEQTTEERYADYTHTAYCLWSVHEPWFEFVIGVDQLPGIVVCSSSSCP